MISDQHKVMITEKYFNFSGSRIKNLKTAIFSDLSTSILKFPTSIITVSRIDTSGNILFTARKPYTDMSNLKTKFFSQLQFYNKKDNYYITIRGKATIVAQKAGKLFDQSLPASNEVLISVLIIDTEYYYSRKKERPALKYYMARMKDW